MEKILTIDGREVKFKSTAAFILRYKTQFKRDAIVDIYKLQNVINSKGKIKNINALDMEVFYNLVWVLAKTADPMIPPPMEWLDTFNVFPLDDILPHVVTMIFDSVETSVTSKKK